MRRRRPSVEAPVRENQHVEALDAAEDQRGAGITRLCLLTGRRGSGRNLAWACGEGEGVR